MNQSLAAFIAASEAAMSAQFSTEVIRERPLPPPRCRRAGFQDAGELRETDCWLEP